MKKVIVILTVAAVMVIGMTVAFATDAFKTPAEIVSDLTGKTVGEVTQARQNGVTYGEQAALDGKLDEFKTERLAQYKLALDQAVAEGRLTQAQADELYAAMKQRMENCTGQGTGSCGAGGGYGCGFNGVTNGCGAGRGSGIGLGRGAGGCGSCVDSNDAS